MPTSRSRWGRPRRPPARRRPRECAACAERGLPMTVTPDLDRRFREAAAGAGLLDVAYDLVDTPVGPLLVAVTDRGVCRISFDPEPDRQVEGLARDFGTRVLRSTRP